MKGSTDADDGGKYLGQRHVIVAVVQVPALAVVVSQPRVGGSCGHLSVEEVCATVRVAGVDDSQPLVDDPAGVLVVVRRPGNGELHRHAEIPCATHDLVPAVGPAIRQGTGEQHGILAVRVEMHKGITAPWPS
ncbi:hypothetical protein [Georgenia deserti]|uniref:Uncharacterized protein n=1 Tax=Georgenia deserti TaxID=2093781 RepID=A0ABW4L0V2_9MICO